MPGKLRISAIGELASAKKSQIARRLKSGQASISLAIPDLDVPSVNLGQDRDGGFAVHVGRENKPGQIIHALGLNNTAANARKGNRL